jgi:hypothetical protein
VARTTVYNCIPKKIQTVVGSKLLLRGSKPLLRGSRPLQGPDCYSEGPKRYREGTAVKFSISVSHIVFAILDSSRRYLDFILIVIPFTCRSVICRNIGDRKYGQYNDGAGQPVLHSRKIQIFFLSDPDPVRSGPANRIISSWSGPVRSGLKILIRSAPSFEAIFYTSVDYYNYIFIISRLFLYMHCLLPLPIPFPFKTIYDHPWLKFQTLSSNLQMTPVLLN